MANTATVALTVVLGSPFSTVGFPTSVAVDPSGRFVYVGDASGLGEVLAYTIDPTSGALAPIAGSPFTSHAADVTVDPSGRFLYAVNFNLNNLSAFTINPSSGALTLLPGSPFTSRV